MKKICFVTATRAEYGLLKPLMLAIKNSSKFDLQILVTGAHLSPEFGLTYQQIVEDGFTIDQKVEMLLSSDTASGIVKTIGVGMIGYADALAALSPDGVVILGDRYEMLGVAAAATIFRIPIIHLHGGEVTEGAYDEQIRHAITKLSSLHFTSTEAYRDRVIQMGESPKRVFNVGAIGLDNIKIVKLLAQEELEQSLGFRFNKYTYQVTFHPETLAEKSSQQQFQILLSAIAKQEDSFFVFTKANADTDGRVINEMIDDFVRNYPDKAIAFHSLGLLRFLSFTKLSTAMVGNSSSGIIEVPSLHTATINIGDRQKGRVQAASVVNCEVSEESIAAAFETVKTDSFRRDLKSIHNPYDAGGATLKIMDALLAVDFHDLKSKSFYNLKLD